MVDPEGSERQFLMDKVEFRVRPVTRYILTKFSERNLVGAGTQHSVETVGEFGNAARANAVGRAMHKEIPGATFTPSDGPTEVNGHQQFAIVERGFDVNARVYYAGTLDEAEEAKQAAARGHGGEWAIFSRAAR